MLFPSKEQRDWDEFMIPFRDGDVIIRTDFNPGCKQYNIAIFKGYNNSSCNKMNIYCQVNGANEFKTEMSVYHKDWRMATAEEGHRLFTRMHESNYDFKEGKLKEKINQIISLLVPMFVISFKRAEDLSNAMEARGYVIGAKRTRIDELKFKALDYVAFVLCLLFLGASIWAKIYF